MLVRTSLRPATFARRVNGRACPSRLLLQKYVAKQDLASLTQSFCNGSCKPLFPRLRAEDCCVNMQDLVRYAIQTNSQLLRVLVVHNVTEFDLSAHKLFLETCVKHRNVGAFCLIVDLLEPVVLVEIWRNLGLTGNMHFLKAISYKLSALQGLIEGGHFDDAKAYAKHNGISDCGLTVTVFEKTEVNVTLHRFDILCILTMSDEKRCYFLESTIHTGYLSGVKYLAHKNSHLDLTSLFNRQLSGLAIDALRECLPRPTQE